MSDAPTPPTDATDTAPATPPTTDAPPADPGGDADGAGTEETGGDPGEAGEGPADDAVRAGMAAGGPGAALASRDGSGPRPPPPPKRTGIFVDPDGLREHIGALLRFILGGYQVDAFGNFTFTHDDARIFVTVGPSPLGPQVGVFSITNLDVELTLELAQLLLATNHGLAFGSFSYDPENHAVWLRHTLLGTTLDGPELQTAVMAIAQTAAQVANGIRDRFGGRTFADAPKDVQEATKPPEATSENYPNASGYL